MRNVDRDVLREAVVLADIKDLFPAEESDAQREFRERAISLLEATAERQALLEGLAFGSIIVRLFRSVIFLLRLLPAVRFVVMALLVFEVLSRVIESKEAPSVADLERWAEQSGLKGLVDDISGQIALRAEQIKLELRGRLEEIQQILGDAAGQIREIGADIELARNQLNQGYVTMTRDILVGADAKQNELSNQLENTLALLLPQLTAFVERFDTEVQRLVNEALRSQFTTRG